MEENKSNYKTLEILLDYQYGIIYKSLSFSNV